MTIDDRFYELLKYLGRGAAFQYYFTPDGEEHTRPDGSAWREKVSYWFPTDQIPKVPATWVNHANCYFGVHPSQRKGTPAQRAKIEDIAAVNCLFAEIDIPKNFAIKADALRHIRALSPGPSVVVSSGGGYHLYWLLQDTYTIGGEAARTRIRAIQDAWPAWAGGDTTVHDLARVLRIPGTLNRKPEYGPVFPTIQIVQFDLTRTIAIGDAEQLVAPLMPQPQPTHAGGYRNGSGPLPDYDLVNFMFAGPFGNEIRALWGGDITGHKSHSEADRAMCKHLGYYTYGDVNTVDRLFRQTGLMRDKWDQNGYNDRTIRHALSSCHTYFDWAAWHSAQSAAAGVAGMANGAGPYVNGAGPATGNTATGTSSPRRVHYAPTHPTPDDYLRALSDLGYTFRLNACDDTIEVNGEQISDALRAQILVEMYEYGYKNATLLENIYHAHAYKYIYHPVKDYLNSLTWDGNDHLHELGEYFDDKHPPIRYTDGTKERVFYAFFRRWCIAAVAKCMHSGQFQAQSNMLVLEGGQDVGKSSFVYWLGSPLPGLFVEGPINPENKDHLRYLCTKWIWEVAELGSTTRKADREALKAFITQVDVTFRLPYGRHPLHKPALASFIGTINNEVGFLSDPTGNRRFWVCGLKDLLWGYSQAIDANQVWAQAYALFQQGEPWRLTPEEREMRDAIHEAYTMERPYESWLSKYFDVDPNEAGWFLPTVDIVEELVSRGVNDNRTTMQMQLATTLRALGLEKGRDGRTGPRGYTGIRVKVGPGGIRMP